MQAQSSNLLIIWLLFLVTNSHPEAIRAYHKWPCKEVSTFIKTWLILFHLQFLLYLHSFLLVQSLSQVQLFTMPRTAAHQAFLSFIISQSLVKLMSTESVILSNISSSVTPFSFCLQSVLGSGSFPVSWLFTSGGQCIGASASALVFPVNIQGWFPFRID